jgi:uncharacterized membrane protein HdeD (DUF308 family)
LETLTRYWWAVALRGALAILFGVTALVWPRIWAIVIGVLEVIAAVRLRRELRREWLLGLSAAVTALFGILLIAWPATGVLTLIALIGISAVVFGVALLAFAERLRRQQRPATNSHRRPATA